MKTSFAPSHTDPEQSVLASAQPARAPLAPLLAGARARGVADGLELVGAAAALLDEHGDVLHVNARALGMMGEGLFVSGQRLRAHGQDGDDSLAAAIEASLRHRVVSRVAVAGADGRPIATVRIVPVIPEGDEAFQLLRAVAIFEAPGERTTLSGLN